MIQNVKIAIIGAGRVGTALARALCAHSYNITAIYDRNANRAAQCAEQCSPSLHNLPVYAFPEDITLLFICVPDDELENAAQEAADNIKITSQAVIAHCSGAKSSQALLPLQNKTLHLASCHPIQTFPGLPDDWQRLSGIYFGLEGDDFALQIIQQLVLDLDSHYVIVPAAKKALYHLGCALASNYMVAVADAALEAMQKAGITKTDARPVLEPLLRSTLDNIIAKGPARAATGPIIRGDTGTIQDHLAAMQQSKPELLPLYSVLGMRLVQIATDLATASQHDLTKIKELLLAAQKNSGLNYE